MSSPVTFLFTDIEGSTRLWEEHPKAMQQALEWHDRVARRIVERHKGRVFKTVGDAFYAVFPTPADAVAAAVEGQRKLFSAEEFGGLPLRVRMAIHTGVAQERDGDYFGASLNRLSRLLSMGAGGQILMTRPTREALLLATPIEDTILVDLGIHRLRDVAQPEHVFELRIRGLSDSAPAHSLTSYPNNLPIQISSFVGRERELSDCRRLLREGRLLTLTGVGGSGKTRLAVQLAAELLGQDGAYLIELAPLQAPSLVGQSIGAALSLRETADRPILEAVVDYLRNRRTLLVLDNCEHMLAEAASAIRLLLQRCPLLKVLATSRENLGIPGETTYKVPPLALPMSDQAPPVEVLAGFEAIRLFVERASSAKGAFGLTSANAATVFEICRRLDGIPLAIELAAARVRSMTLEQIVDRLDDQFRLLSAGSRGVLPRQQTLRALVDWSYDLLTDDEKLLLDRLSVFVSGFTLAAAEAVCSQDQIEDVDVLDLLTRLMDKSLVQYDDRGEDVRYRLLETIRQYAIQRLAERGESGEIAMHHLRYFAQFAQTARPHIQSGDRTWLERVSREHDNIRSALDRCNDSPDTAELAVRLTAAMTVFWNNRGHLTEARARFRTALECADQVSPSLRAEAVLGAAVIESSLGNHDEAVQRGEEAVSVWRSLDEESNIAFGLLVLGNIRIQLRDLEGAARDYEEGMLIRLRMGDTDRLAIPLNNLGYIAYQRGDYGKAQRMIEEAIRLSRESGNRQIIVNATHSLAMVFKDLGQLDNALDWMRQSLSAAAELNHHVPIALRLEGVAYVLEQFGDDELAARLIGAADTIRRAINYPVPSLERPQHDQHLEALRKKLEGRFELAMAEGSKLSEEQAIALALGSTALVH